MCHFLQELEREEEVESELEKLQETLDSLETALQRSGTPDLKALQKMNEVKEMFHGIVEGRLQLPLNEHTLKWA